MNDRDGNGGQIVVLFAIVLILLIAAMALAIDVSNAYQARREYRTFADAAALAGGQQLVQESGRAVGDYNQARSIAAASLEKNFERAATCTTAGTDAICTFAGIPHVAKIRAPLQSGDCVLCDPQRSMQVTVGNPTFPLSFANLFGFGTFDVSAAAVAGLSFESSYALVTLRPPRPLPNGLDQNREDVETNGTNTVINILSGDIGTNTSAVTNSGSRIVLADGYFIGHYDDIVPDPWNKDASGNPQGRLITELIEDPNWVNSSAVPNRTGVQTYTTQAEGEDVDCDGLPASLASATNLKCYNPGIYAGGPSQVFTVGPTESAYLKPGMYFLDRGAQISGSLYGGIENGGGVSIWVPQDQSFDALSTLNFQLNTASVTAPTDGAGVPQVTDEDLILTLQVQRDNNCFNGLVPQLCSDNQNNSLKIGGQATFRVGGVIYGPSDQMRINSSDQSGQVGQIYAWTATYSGDATLNQSYYGDEEPGLLRLDAACTAPGTPCRP